MQKKLLFYNLYYSLLLLLVSIIIDILEVQFKMISLQQGRMLYRFIYPISFIMFSFINRPCCNKIENKYLRWISIIGIGALVSIILWFFILVIGVNIRIKIIGGGI